MDDAGLGGRAAHIEGDRVLEPDAIAQRLGADHARRWSGLEHADAGALRLLDAEQAAGRLHDQKAAVEVRSNSRYSCESSCGTKRCGWLASIIAFTRCSCAGLR